MRFITSYIVLITLCLSCKNTTSLESDQKMAKLPPVQTQPVEGYERAYFASGCFWCVEVIFESIKGVKEAVSGYSGGFEEHPTYKEVSYGKTNHAEAVEVFYNPDTVSYRNLVIAFFGSHDPRHCIAKVLIAANSIDL